MRESLHDDSSEVASFQYIQYKETYCKGHVARAAGL